MDMPPNFDRPPPPETVGLGPLPEMVGPGSLTLPLVFAVVCLALMAAATMLPPLPMDLGTLPAGP